MPAASLVTWPYYSDLNTNSELYIDYTAKGNYMNFFNFTQHFNCHDIIIPYNNQWLIIFVTAKQISKGQQILLSLENNQYLTDQEYSTNLCNCFKFKKRTIHNKKKLNSQILLMEQ